MYFHVQNTATLDAILGWGGMRAEAQSLLLFSHYNLYNFMFPCRTWH